MPVYIALLRGINVSGQKKIRMSDLRDILQNSGFPDVQTYIQSGNLVFSSTEEDCTVLRTKIRDVIAAHYGFDVEVWLSEREAFMRIADQNPFLGGNDVSESNLYYVFPNEPASVERVEELQSAIFENEEFRITDQCIYLSCLKGYGKAKCNNNFFEKRLKVVATTRNLKTVQKLIEISSAI